MSRAVVPDSIAYSVGKTFPDGRVSICMSLDDGVPKR